MLSQITNILSHKSIRKYAPEASFYERSKYSRLCIVSGAGARRALCVQRNVLDFWQKFGELIEDCRRLVAR